MELDIKDFGKDIPDVAVGIFLLPIPDAEVRLDFDLVALNG